VNYFRKIPHDETAGSASRVTPMLLIAFLVLFLLTGRVRSAHFEADWTRHSAENCGRPPTSSTTCPETEEAATKKATEMFHFFKK
jgi:hypothetical protein